MAPGPDNVDDEMHELNQEADYLDQSVTVDSNNVNGKPHHRHSGSSGNDPDAQAQVITSLRGQIQDLYSQVTQLNNKLVHSYDRVSDLEDELHVTSTNLKGANSKISQLELERSEHLSALSTGLLVEKANVTSELTRLMEKATEEAARAGEAESARVAIEKDLDDLSAGLFDQANTMVAEARLARARSERKVRETEAALRGAEEIVGILQTQLQTMQSEKEEVERKVQDMRVLMGKGKWVERSAGPGVSSVRLLCLHTPYLDFLQFIAHLRTIRPSTQNAPLMATLLPLPFLARLIVEDSDPTVRLDLAPSLNWLTRRSVLSAIHSGQLMVEPMSTTALVEELAPLAAQSHSHSHIVCALCGTAILDPPALPARPSPNPLSSNRSVSQSKSSWGPSFLKTSIASTIAVVPFGNNSRPETPTTPAEAPLQVFIFKLEATSSSGLPMAQGNQAKPATVYPLCTSGWCLARLRTTCSLWSFIRTGVVERIWEEEPFVPPTATGTPPPETPPPSAGGGRSRMGIGSLWGTMSRSLSNTTPRLEDRPPSEASSPKPAEVAKKDFPNLPRRLPPPPPRHAPLPPPLPVRPAGPPPPLPKRNRPVPPPPPPRPANILPPAYAKDEKPEEEQEEKEEEGRQEEKREREDEKDEKDEKEKENEEKEDKEHRNSISVPPSEFSPPVGSEDAHDAFATPSEEIAQPTTSRPSTPSSVPLPMSRANSPEPPAPKESLSEGSETQITVTPPEPEELSPKVDELSSPEPTVSIEAPKVPATISESTPVEARPAEIDTPASAPSPADAAPGPAPATGAPPPLPRRAATRARPPSHPSLSGMMQPPKPQEATKPVEGSEREAEAGRKSLERFNAEKGPDTEKGDTARAGASEKDAHTSEAPEIVTSGPSSPPLHPLHGSDDNGDDSDKDRHDMLETTSPADLSDLSPAEPSTPVSDAELEDANSEVNLSSNEDLEEDAEMEEGDEKDEANYVGETTWEERTWREIVKLREDMFWARIGGVR